MSGIVALLNTDGAPVDPLALRELTAFLAYCGPDGSHHWHSGPIGLGHALFRTTDDFPDASCPCTLEGDVWITADARIDGRDDLVRQLEAAGRTGAKSASDAELILHAWHAWGEACLDHLIGDFTFVLWDERSRHLFCARDQLGIKPLYYAQTADGLVISNVLDCVREHDAVTDELNELSVADYLLFRCVANPGASFFSDVHRLPPGHSLSARDGEVRIHRYWTMQDRGEVHFRRPAEYVDKFRQILFAAVRDRLRTARVAVKMSGGMDSTAVAAAAKQLLDETGRPYSLTAHTLVFDRLIPDHERHFSSLAAATIGIRIRHYPLDGKDLFQHLEDPAHREPRPNYEPYMAAIKGVSEEISLEARVALTGWDGDSVCRERSLYYFGALRHHGRYGRLIADLLRYVRYFGRIPELGIRSGIKRWLRGERDTAPSFPEWLDESLVRRLDLRNRWREENARWNKTAIHPRRPCGFQGLGAHATWSDYCECHDPGYSGTLLEVRNPLADLRLLDFGHSLPAVPWCMQKEVMRRSMDGLLPQEVLTRPKTLLAGMPEIERLKEQPDPFGPSRFERCTLNAYVDLKRLLADHPGRDPASFGAKARVRALGVWLQQQARHDREPQLTNSGRTTSLHTVRTRRAEK